MNVNDVKTKINEKFVKLRMSYTSRFEKSEKKKSLKSNVHSYYVKIDANESNVVKNVCAFMINVITFLKIKKINRDFK